MYRILQMIWKSCVPDGKIVIMPFYNVHSVLSRTSNCENDTQGEANYIRILI